MVIRRLIMSLAVTAAAAVTVVSAAKADAACDVETMNTNPMAAIAPCTVIIDDLSRPASERAAALYIRGTILGRNVSNELARADITEGLKLDDRNSLLQQAMAWILSRYGEYDEAYEHAVLAQKINPNGITENFRLAVIYSLVKSPSTLDQFDRLIELDPGNLFGRFSRLHMHLESKNFSAASIDLQYLEQVPDAILEAAFASQMVLRTENFPIREVFVSQRHKILVGLGKYQEALAGADKFIEDSPQSALAYFSRGNVRRSVPEALKPNGEDNALSDYKKAIELQPTYHDASNTLAQLQLYYRMYDQAALTVDQALKVTTDTSWAGYFLWLGAKAQRGKNDIPGAISYAKESIELQIQNGELNENSGFVMAAIEAGYLDKSHPLTSFDDALSDALVACMHDEACGRRL
jgi:tetratricopeptide (TPR) repeat protein